MQLRFTQREIQGSAADLFFDRSAEVVYKLFRRTANARGECAARKVFEAECAAYDLATKHDHLKTHIPTYHGPIGIDAVVDRAGHRRSRYYLLDCCYATALLPGPVVKWYDTPDAYEASIQALFAKFDAAGIRYVADADVWGWEDPVTMKLLDFATYDALARYG